MNDLFLKVAAATPDIRVADPDYNTEHIIECMQKANTEHAKLLVFIMCNWAKMKVNAEA